MAQNGDNQLPRQLSNDVNPKNLATVSSKQLLYSEKFEDNSLKILDGNSKNSTVSPKTFKLPPSSVLGQVKNFLPKMMEANVKLEEKLRTDPENLDIENVEDSEEFIEMNLALVEDQNSSDSDSDSDSEERDSSDNENGTKILADNSIKILLSPDKSKSAKIEVLENKSGV